jgi:hypothetical protein
MPVNAYFWKGGRLVIMPDIAAWSIDVEREFHGYRLGEDEPDFLRYMTIGASTRVRIRPRRIYVKRRLEPGDSGALRIFCEGRDYRVASAVLCDVGGGDLDFRSAAPATIAERPLRAR